MDTVWRHAERLIRDRAVEAAGRAGARAVARDVTEQLVCLLEGATTWPMRTAIVQTAATPPAPDSRVAILTAPARRAPTPKRPFDTGSFVFWYAAGVAAVTLVLSGWIAREERAGCRPDDCAGRPDTFCEALRWLGSNLVWMDSGLSPVDRNWVFGALYRVLGLVSVAVVVAAAYRFVKWQRPILEDKAIVERNRILILVVLPVERDEVLKAVRAVNGAAPRREQHSDHTVWYLGELGGAEILLAQSGEQGAGSPTGMQLAALAVIEWCEPAYVILTGICYGLKEDLQELGDIIVAQRVINIDHREVRDDEVFDRGTNVPPAAILMDRFLAATVSWQAPPHVHFGPMLSAQTKLDSERHRQELKARYPVAVGGEMEGAAVYAAAAKQRTDWIVVKGISDLGRDWSTRPDPRIAAANAAVFVVSTLRSAGLDDPVRRGGAR